MFCIFFSFNEYISSLQNKKQTNLHSWFLFFLLLLYYNSIRLLYTWKQIEINFIKYALNSNVIKKNKNKNYNNHVFFINVGDLFSCIKAKASHMISTPFRFIFFVVSIVTLLAVFSSSKCAICVGKC